MQGQTGRHGPRERVAIKKTWKLYVGGAFVRSESGRYLVTRDGTENYPCASRKDVRDAVRAGLATLAAWNLHSAYQRGQILYRLAEVLESRNRELVDSLARAGGRQPEREVHAAIDRVVSFAGWTDKFQPLLGSVNPVAGPYFAFSVPEPVGLVGLSAPDRPALLGLIGSVCPIIASGNAVVAVVSETDPRTALLLGECLATSDLPNGVVNLLSGRRPELLPVLAAHKAVRALDLWDMPDKQALALGRAAAESCKRVSRQRLTEAEWFDEERGTALATIERFVEVKSIWHPTGV